ncbi:MAG: hypothetical protein M0D53_17390 [Flavobacterium sp. JAD_PAG50586_2]|nr:MAG: hypothetical protein M0D53_17390 [Flavobacterium sp. JAD_PAG50586_2]
MIDNDLKTNEESSKPEEKVATEASTPVAKPTPPRTRTRTVATKTTANTPAAKPATTRTRTATPAVKKKLNRKLL